MTAAHSTAYHHDRAPDCLWHAAAQSLAPGRGLSVSAAQEVPTAVARPSRCIYRNAQLCFATLLFAEHSRSTCGARCRSTHTGRPRLRGGPLGGRPPPPLLLQHTHRGIRWAAISAGRCRLFKQRRDVVLGIIPGNLTWRVGPHGMHVTRPVFLISLE